MANLLKMAISESIRTLRHRGWSQRRIADELGINRETVARHLRQADPPSKPANAPTGSDSDQSESKPAKAPAGSEDDLRAPELTLATPASTPDPPSRGNGRASGCEPWRELVRAKCDLGFSAQRIYQDLVAENGFVGSYYCVRRFVHRLEETHDLPFRRMECDPGDEAQIQ
jgi:Helix-turn-helix domain